MTARRALTDVQRVRLKSIFDRAIDMPSERRNAFVRDESRDDLVLHGELTSLLEAHDASDGYFEKLSERLIAPALSSIDFGDRDDAFDAAERQVSHYELIERIGGGGMGVVYKGRDTRLGRTVALKFLPRHHAANPAARARLLAEARTASALDHPNIGVVYEIGETDDGRQFIAMAWYDGETLKDKARQGPLAVSEVVDISIQLSRALSAAHATGIIHRDVKPANVIITRSGTAKLVDFGIAKLISEDNDQRHAAAGTVAYMSPEQTLGTGVDTRTDVWSLGVLLYELLAGRRPFQGESDDLLVSAIRDATPPPIAFLRPDVPPALSGVVERCLQKNPADRYQTAGDLCDALIRWDTDTPSRHEATRTGAPALGERIAPPARRTPRTIVAMVVLAAAGFAVWGYSGYSETSGRESIATGPAVSLAVLPFDDSSAPDSLRYLADGLSDELRADLAQVGALAVASYPSSVPYAGSHEPVTRTAAELSADFIVSGNIERARAAVRAVEVSVLDGRTGKVLWRKSYGSERSAIAGISNDATREIVSTLDVDLTRAEKEWVRRAPPRNSRAYDLYLRGRYAEQSAQPTLVLEPVSVEKMRRAQALYAQARALDPAFGRLRARLALTHMFSATTYDTTRARLEQGRLEADIAMSLDSQLVEPRQALSAYWRRVGNRQRAIDELQAGLRKAPNNVDLLLELGLQLQEDGRWDEAISQFSRAMELDPRNARAAWLAATTYGRMRRNGEGMKAFDRLLDVSPRDHEVRVIKGQSYLRWKGSTEMLADGLRRIPRGWDNRGMATYARYTVLWIERRYREGLAMLDSLPSGISRDGLVYHPFSLMRAEMHHSLGEEELARRHYEIARRELTDSSAAHPGDASIHAALGLAYAGLGRKREAIAEAEKAMDLVRVTTNNRNATAFMGIAIEVFGRVGETDRAFEMIELLLSMQSGREVTLPFLRVWPGFDPLRGDPRFEQLLERFATS